MTNYAVETAEYKVREVKRWIVTRYYKNDAGSHGVSEVVAELPQLNLANRILDAMYNMDAAQTSYRRQKDEGKWPVEQMGRLYWDGEPELTAKAVLTENSVAILGQLGIAEEAK